MTDDEIAAVLAWRAIEVGSKKFEDAARTIMALTDQFEFQAHNMVVNDEPAANGWTQRTVTFHWRNTPTA